MAPFEIVIGNAGAEMVDVVKADVAREPLEDFRELVERTAFEGRLRVVPILAALPVNAFELMLYVKEPYARAACDHEDDQMNEQILFDPENGAQPHGHPEDGKVHPIHGMALALVRAGRRNSLLNEKQIKGRDDEQDDRVTREAIREFFPAGGFEIFLHGECPDVTGAALVEIAGAGVVNGVFPPPVVIGSEREYARDESHNVIDRARFEIRSVAAVMENDKDAHDKSARENGQRHDQPPGNGKREIHEIPERGVGYEGVDHLPDGPGSGGVGVFGHNLFPPQSVRSLFFRNRI